MEGAACGGDGGRENEQGAACGVMKLPGFRFHPTDEELVGFYLRKRVLQQQGEKFRGLQSFIPDLDIYKYDPWDLPRLAKLGEGHSGCYFFSPRDRKYRNSTRPNRVTLSGFWKATGTDRPVHSGGSPSECIGLKKSLVFYLGRASRGNKTDWMMHEFRLPNQPDYSEKDTCWALCKIFKRKSSNSQYMSETQAFVAEDLPGTAETNLDKLEALDSFGGEDCSEEDSKSENTTHTSLAPGHVPSSVDIHTPSSCTSQDEFTLDCLIKSSESTKSVARFSRPREPPLTVRVSKSSNGWADDLLTSWLSPAIMKPFDNFRTGGQPCIGDTNLLLTDQSLQESLHVFTPDGLGHVFCSPLWNPTLPLWEQPAYFHDSMTFNTTS